MAIALLEILENTYNEYNLIMVDNSTLYSARSDGGLTISYDDKEITNISLYALNKENVVIKSVIIRLIPEHQFFDITIRTMDGEKERALVGGGIYHGSVSHQAYYSEEMHEKLINLLILLEDKFGLMIADKVKQF
jgi:hypothetical protein